MENSDKCKICGALVNLKLKFRGGRVFKCSNCGFETKISETKIPAEEIYKENYFAGWENDEYKKIKKENFKLLLANLNISERTSQKLLDVGCANGILLKLASDFGLKTYGIEYSAAAAAMTKKFVPEAKIFCGDLLDANLGDEKFDIIVLADVVEHIHQPVPLFKKIIGWLAKDGIIAITTPDPDSLSANLLGKFWPHYIEEHLVFFSKESLKIIADKFNLKIIKLGKNKKSYNLNFLMEQVIQKKMFPFVLPAKIMKHVIPEYFRKKTFKLKTGEHLIIYQSRRDCI